MEREVDVLIVYDADMTPPQQELRRRNAPVLYYNNRN